VRVTLERYVVRGPNSRHHNSSTSIASFFTPTQYIEFVFSVCTESKSWQFQTRFSHIDAVYKILCQRFSNVPALPSKTLVRHFYAEHIEERMHGLQGFFNALCRRRDLLNCPELATFLQLPEHIPEFKNGNTSAPSQVAEIVEMQFGIEDFHYDMESGYLLIGSSDQSLGSKVDYAISSLLVPRWESNTSESSIRSRMSLWKRSDVTMKFELKWSCNYCIPLTKVTFSKSVGHAFCAMANGSIGFRPKNRELAQYFLPMIKHTDTVTSVVFDESEHWLFSTSRDGKMLAYDVRTMQVAAEMNSPRPVHELALDKAGRRLYGGSGGGYVFSWDIRTLPPQLLSTVNIPQMRSMHFSTTAFDIPALFIGSREGITILQMKTATGQSWGRNFGNIFTRQLPLCLTFAASSREIIVGHGDGTVAIFDVDSGQATFVFQAHHSAITSLCFLDAPRQLVTASRDERLRFWDFPSMKRTSLIIEPVPAVQGFSKTSSLEKYVNDIPTYINNNNGLGLEKPFTSTSGKRGQNNNGAFGAPPVPQRTTFPPPSIRDAHKANQAERNGRHSPSGGGRDTNFQHHQSPMLNASTSASSTSRPLVPAARNTTSYDTSHFYGEKVSEDMDSFVRHSFPSATKTAPHRTGSKKPNNDDGNTRSDDMSSSHVPSVVDDHRADTAAIASEPYITEDPYVHRSFVSSHSPPRIRRDGSWSPSQLDNNRNSHSTTRMPRTRKNYGPGGGCSMEQDGVGEDTSCSSLNGWYQEREQVLVDDSQLKQENRKGGIVSRACLESDSDDDSLIGWNN